MTYTPKPETANWEAPPGVAPWRVLSDAEYAEISAAYEAQFSPEQAGCLARWFDRTPATTEEVTK